MLVSRSCNRRTRAERSSCPDVASWEEGAAPHGKAKDGSRLVADLGVRSADPVSRRDVLRAVGMGGQKPAASAVVADRDGSKRALAAAAIVPGLGCRNFVHVPAPVAQ